MEVLKKFFIVTLVFFIMSVAQVSNVLADSASYVGLKKGHLNSRHYNVAELTKPDSNKHVVYKMGNAIIFLKFSYTNDGITTDKGSAYYKYMHNDGSIVDALSGKIGFKYTW